MTVTLRLFGSLKQYLPESERNQRQVTRQISDGTTAQSLILELGMPYGEDEGMMVVAVNDREVDHSTPIKDGDRISIFEPLAGG